MAYDKLIQPGCNQKAAQLKKKDPHLPKPVLAIAAFSNFVSKNKLTKIKSRGKK